MWNILTEADDKTLITITPEWMEENFNRMNKLLFSGMLPVCRFSLFTTGKGSQGHTLGWFKTNRDYLVNYRFMSWSPYGCSGWQFYLSGQDSMEPEDFARHMNPLIQLNGNYNWTEKAALSTLVHEMCHYRQHIFGFYEATGKKTIHHGVTFMRIAEEVSRKSNEFFTVEKIAKAEQMDQMDFNDEMKAKHNAQASKGIHFFKFELAAPETAGNGKVYKCAYAIPASTKYKDYLALLPTYKASRYKRIVDCVTTDGNIKKYRTVKTLGSWYYSPGNTIDDVMPDVRVDGQTEINVGGESTLPEPYYIFKLKYITPYYSSKKRTSYKYGYKIVKPGDFNRVSNFVSNQKDKYSYACWCEVYDAHILEHNVLKDTDTNYITNNWDVLSDVKQGEYTVLYGNDGTEQPKQSSLSSFLYGNGGNPHLKTQQEKRYSFTMNTMKNGVPGVFTISNATEKEAKQQMRERFPKWTEEMIDMKFKMYTQGQNESRQQAISQIVENVMNILSQQGIVSAKGMT